MHPVDLDYFFYVKHKNTYFFSVMHIKELS